MGDFKEMDTGNFLMKADGFSISYRPYGTGPFAGTSFDTEQGCGETAIVTGGDFFILNGDHRHAYMKASPDGLNACVEYFNRNIELKSGFSDTPEVLH